MVKRKPSLDMEFPVGNETLKLKMPKHGTPRFTATAAESRVPREAASIWQMDPRPFTPLMRRWPPEYHHPHTKATRQMQSYFRGEDVPRTVGENVLYKGMHPSRLDRDDLVATTTRPAVANSFANGVFPRGEGVLYRLSIPPNTPFLPIPPTTDQGEEHEILLPPGSIRITGSPRAIQHDLGIIREGRNAGGMMSATDEMTPAKYVPRLSRKGRPNMNLGSGSSISSGAYSSTSAEITQQSGSADKGKGKGKGKRKASTSQEASTSRRPAPAKRGAAKASGKKPGKSGFAFKF